MVRLQNPIILPEHGMQIGVVELSMLFWVTALEMLFMTGGNCQGFRDRIAGFLGPDQLLFPPTPTLHHQRRYKVGDVLEDLYKLRNVVAHGGLPPADPFQRAVVLVAASGIPIDGQNYVCMNLLQESALFLLCRSLRKVFVEALVDVVKDESTWKQRLKIGARCSASITKRATP